ncbi:MAG: hypothetical protein ACK4E8_12935, partial [Lacibacter sp.]
RLAACFLNASKSNDCFSVMSICVCFKVTKLQTDTLFATLSSSSLWQDKRVSFSPAPKEIHFYSSLPSVFCFFATHNRDPNSWAETAKTLSNNDLTMTEVRQSACNSRLTQVTVKW